MRSFTGFAVVLSTLAAVPAHAQDTERTRRERELEDRIERRFRARDFDRHWRFDADGPRMMPRIRARDFGGRALVAPRIRIRDLDQLRIRPVVPRIRIRDLDARLDRLDRLERLDRLDLPEVRLRRFDVPRIRIRDFDQPSFDRLHVPRIRWDRDRNWDREWRRESSARLRDRLRDVREQARFGRDFGREFGRRWRDEMRSRVDGDRYRPM